MLYRAELFPESSGHGQGGIRTLEGLTPTRFPIVLLKPLGHLSTCPSRRGWDSNPRGPFGPDGLANRCRNHLATSPNRPQTLPLLGSNQDSSEPESDVLPITPRGTLTAKIGLELRFRKSVLHFGLRTSVVLLRQPKLHASGRRGSNPRPSAWEADALPTELLPRQRRLISFATTCPSCLTCCEVT